MSRLFSDLSLDTKKGYFLPHLKLEGSYQMALDELLLRQSINSCSVSIVFRFYSWQGSWISIGRNQREIPNRWKSLLRQNKLKIVRRPTGGEAVLHSGGITYSLIWKSPNLKKSDAYYQASQWLINGFSELGIPLQFGKEKASFSSGNCFATSTAADLIDNEGNKRIGSAQLWRRGHVLQHGEILLNPPKNLWHDIFQTKPPKQISIDLPKKEIEESLKRNLHSSWPNINWKEREITNFELKEIKSNSKNYLFNSGS
tara:strand:- start:954 stop:1724 length:771 start_codon:yes stop_codon:yes gene_type:complete